MPVNRSAIKRARLSSQRNLRNRMVKTRVKTEVRKYAVALGEDASKAGEQLKAASSMIDRAVTKGVLHKNAANRRKSRLAKALNKAQAGG